MNNLIQSKLEEFRKLFVITHTLGHKVIGEKFRVGEVFLSPEKVEQFLSQSLEEAYRKGREDTELKYKGYSQLVKNSYLK